MYKSLKAFRQVGTKVERCKQLMWRVKSTTIAATLLLAAVSLHSQSLKFSIDSTKHSMFHITEYKLQIYDSAKGLVAYQVKDSALVVLDSLATIKTLMNCIEQMKEQIKINYQEIERGYTAMQILMYVQINGRISNRKKFDAAVKRYLKLHSIK